MAMISASNTSCPKVIPGDRELRSGLLGGCVEGDVEWVDGHARMGDLAKKDAQGNVTITGRLKLLIDSGGFKVNPLEVERVLLEHSDVADCAVTAMELSDTIQRVFAFVVARDVAHPPGERALRSGPI